MSAGPSTRSVHLLSEIDPSTRAVVPPVVANAAFAYDTVEDWRRVALGEVPGDIYSRNSNPTVRLCEQKMAALEGADAAVAFANGMGAIAATLFALLAPGHRAVTVKDAYGGTYLTFTELLPGFGVACEVCETDDPGAIEAAIGRGCQLLYLESPTNPMLKVVDLARFAAAAHRAGAIVVVDNTFATPLNQSPIALGADLVIHSATKFIGGHGDVMGGVVCGRRALIDRIYRWREIAGGALDPQSAFLFLRSLKTLGLRVARQNENAMGLARFLEAQPAVARVHYPGLASHAAHALAARQMTGFGGRRFSQRLTLIERFTMSDVDTLQYTATVDDPGTWTRPWTLSFPWKREPVYGMFEYACHEGNYAMRNMLSASRAAEAGTGR